MNLDHYSDIIYSLAASKVKFVVAGGVAAAIHGVQRLTLDIDIAVEMSKENLILLLEVLKGLRMKPRMPVADDFILDSENRAQVVREKSAIVFTFIDASDPLKHLDIFLTPEHFYEDLMLGCDIFSIGGASFCVASIDKLIELKSSIEPPRPKDLSDIAELTRLKLNKHGQR